MRIRTIVLRNEHDDDHKLWVKACDEYHDSLEYRIVNLTTANWFEEIQKEQFDILLAKPGGLTTVFKQLYDERIFILGLILGYKIFPSPLEIFIYENKRVLSYWLSANKLPHPDTYVFYNRDEARIFAMNVKLPFVAKTNIGASGSGVEIIKSRLAAEKYINNTFSGKGAKRKVGPNLTKGDYFSRLMHYALHPAEINRKLNIYRDVASDIQSGFVIFQDFIPHDYEWRVVRIGDSYFAHKKLKNGEKASGSLLKMYDNPPLKLLDFVKGITDKYKLYSQAIDIFESGKGYLINEMQCIFGQSDTYQMLINGKAGRYKYHNAEWIFEEGDFTKNECYNLRMDFVIRSIQKSI